MDQLVHSPGTQSTGQVEVLEQGWVRVSDGQAAPPFFASTTIDREEVLVPLPQVVLHEDQEDHVSTTQSTGTTPNEEKKIKQWMRKRRIK